MIREIARFAGNIPAIRKIGYYVLGFNQFLWERLPEPVLKWGTVQSYGRVLHDVAKERDSQTQSPWTYFLRNRAELV